MCAQCIGVERQCTTCGAMFTGRYQQCRPCRMPPATCKFPGCDQPKVPGRGSKFCQEHRDDAYQRKLERIRKTAEEPCREPGCPEPKLPGRFRYCATHSAESAQRESAQVVRRKRERDYGITHREFLALLEAQGDVCAICGNGEDSRDKRSLSVDHCHSTGQIRGLLCNRCNPMLGYARDNIAVLQAAIAYLLSWEDN